MLTLVIAVLMFVFWYCHKRGKEVRLAQEAEAAGEGEQAAEDGEEGGEGEDFEASGDEYAEEGEDEEQPDDDSLLKDVDEKANALSQPDPTEVPVPEEGEKTGTVSEEKREDVKE
jgi:hypothetical protein